MAALERVERVVYCIMAAPEVNSKKPPASHMTLLGKRMGRETEVHLLQV
jgi:hypothetical protein